MDKQMELFEEGGLKDEGGMVDEVSGNDVPVGSTREEVRDDIPAQLSEGEFVFPADVTRYIGLDKLMQLRQQAKMGLKKMEAMGQMGNSDEATLPDDLPFGMEDLIIIQAEGADEPQEFNQGGMAVDPNTGVYYTNNTGVTMLPPTQQQPPAQQPQPTTPTTTPMQPTGTGAAGGYQPLFMQGQPQTQAPTFSSLMSGSELTYKTYVNAAGDNILVPFIGDNPLYPIPEGYTLSTGIDEETGRPTGGGGGTGAGGTGGAGVGTGVAQVIESGGGDDGPPPVEPSAFQKAGGWGMDTSGKDGTALDMWIKEAQKVTGHGNVVTGILGLINPLMGAAAWAANKHQKSQILKMLDEKIAQAKLTPIEGQVAALRKIKDELENGSNKGILGKAIDLVSDALGLSEEEKEVAKKNTSAAVDETVTTPTDTDDVEGTDGTDKTTSKITTIDGTTAETTIKDAGYDSVEDYAAEVQRRMMQGNETQQDVVKQTVVDMSGAPGFRKRDDITSVETVTAPFLEEAPVVSADEIARANLAATAFKDRGINAENITAAEFEMIKNSEEAKAALGIDPNISTYSQVKQQTADVLPKVTVETPKADETPEAAVDTTLGQTSVMDSLMDTRGLVGGTRLGDKVPFNLMGYGSEKPVDTKDDPLYTFFTSDRSTEIIDRIASGEPVSVAQISQYLETVGSESAPSSTQQLLDTGTRVAPDTSATMAERDRFYREKAAREEAERLAREESARKAAAEEAARQKAEEEARVRAAMEEAARARAAEEARLQAQRDAAQRAAAQQQQQQAEQTVMSQPVSNKSSYNTPIAPIFKDTQTASQKKASDVGFGSKTGGWTPSGFNFNRTGGGGGGRAKGGLLEKPKAKKTKTVSTKKRGLAARKK